MQPRFITRYTTIAVFLCTCCLTFDVNARELELGSRPSPSNATKLTPEALQLLSDANALLEGFTPATVTPFELTPRRKVKKTMPVRIENSRVKVKFADELQIRLDVHNQLYSRTGLSSSTISDLVNALGVTLTPVHTDSPASIDALIRRAELHSGKQQPDIAGTYWVEGDSSAVDVAAELFYTLEEVEWVMYKPLLIRPNANEANGNWPYTAQVEPKKQNPQNIAKATLVVKEYGACWFSQNDCESDLEKYDCIDYGGTFLGNNSVCRTSENTKQERNAVPEYMNGDWCGTINTPENQRRMQRMLDDGTWEKYRLGEARGNQRGGNIVNITAHIVRYDDGTEGLSEEDFHAQVAELNINVAATGLEFCVKGDFVYHDDSSLADTVTHGIPATYPTVGMVANTMNVYCLPVLNGAGGFASFPPGLNFCIENTYMGPAWLENSVFTHETGHYFNLPHTFDNTQDGTDPEPVDPAFPGGCDDCANSGDFICDTPADVSLGEPETFSGFTTCNYIGTDLDQCGSGLLYDPIPTNIMSYMCLKTFTAEQLNVFLATAGNERSNLLSVTCDAEPPATGACCLANDTCVDGQTQAECLDLGGIYQGPDTLCAGIDCEGGGDPNLTDAICCFMLAAGGMNPGCQDISNEDCLNFNGIYMPAEEAEEGEDICDDFTDCLPDLGPFYADYDDCGESGDYLSYFTGDCYIDQTVCAQTNRQQPPPGGAPPPGCLDTPLLVINGNYVVETGAPLGPGTVFEEQLCCETIYQMVPWCDPANGLNNSWDSQCASYAIAYALAGGDECKRSPDPTNPDAPEPCSAGIGPNQGAAMQPRIDMENVGTNISITFNTPPAIPVEYSIQDNGGVKELYLAFNGILEPAHILNGESIADTATYIQITAFNSGVDLTAQCCAWTGCCEGEDPPNVLCETALEDNCAEDAGWLGTISMVSLESTPQLFASVIRGGCISPVGLPSSPRVLNPSPNNGPNYAEMGLLTWMSPDQIPHQTLNSEQLYALPSSTTELSPEEILQVQQLLPWPMGGYSVSGVCAIDINVPVISPDQTITFTGEGINLFPNPVNQGGFGQSEPYLGAYGYGQQWEDEGVGINGALGNGVKVAVIDWSAHLEERTNEANLDVGGQHAELEHVILEGPDTGHDELHLVFDENIRFAYSADHGSGILGIIGAPWGPNSAPGIDLETKLENNIGVLGMAPDAELYFFPLVSVEDPTGREEAAWLHALGTLDPGDVICAAYRPVIVSDTQPNLNYWDDTITYLEVAKNLGISTVIQAGNRGVDLSALEFEDQHAIVAAAVSPGDPWKRWATGSAPDQGAGGASNYSTSIDVSVVTASSWGMGVTTCGKGPRRDNYLGYNTIIYDDPTNTHSVHEYAYTNNFSGTSAAAAVVTGAVVMLQGFAKQIFADEYGSICIPTEIARQLIAGGKFEGVDKEGELVMPPPPDVDTEVSGSDCQPAGTIDPQFSWDMCAAIGEATNYTGNLANPRVAMINAIYNPIFDNPTVDSIIIIRGNYHLGNIHSIARVDGNLFGVSGVSTYANQPYFLPDTVPGGYVRYPSGGNVSDIYLTGELETTLPANNRLTVEINFEDTQPDQFYLRCEMWDFRRRSWEQASGTAVVVRDSDEVELLIENASRFINRDTTQYHLRLTTAVTNLPDDTQPPYPIMYDQILVKTGLTQVPNP